MGMMKVDIHEGGFDTEQIFSFVDSNGQEVSMCAPKHYFPQRGWVTAHVIRLAGDNAVVSLPSIQCWEAFKVPIRLLGNGSIGPIVVPH
jgi:hypothetical protein